MIFKTEANVSTMQASNKNPSDSVPINEQIDGKMFDNYGPVDVRETIGTFFLGILAILLFSALQRAQNRYESLLEQTQARS